MARDTILLNINHERKKEMNEKERRERNEWKRKERKNEK